MNQSPAIILPPKILTVPAIGRQIYDAYQAPRGLSSLGSHHPSPSLSNPYSLRAIFTPHVAGRTNSCVTIMLSDHRIILPPPKTEQDWMVSTVPPSVAEPSLSRFWPTPAQLAQPTPVILSDIHGARGIAP
jgi:hypothetical protein